MIEVFVDFMNKGGIVMWVLFGLNLLLWYAIGYRHLILQRGRQGNVRRLVEKHIQKGGEKKIKGLLDKAVVDALKADADARRLGKKPRDFINNALMPYYIEIKEYSIVVKTIVILAPLIGLLGTVMGMIETFDALQNSAMFSQGNSISGGISKALFTTELGLVVAVPGLIFGNILAKKQHRFELEFEQMTDIISTKEDYEV